MRAVPLANTAWNGTAPFDASRPAVRAKKSPAHRSRGFLMLFAADSWDYFLGFLMLAWAAARRAMGTRKGLQET